MMNFRSWSNLTMETDVSFSNLLELAANDDIEGFKCSIKCEPSAIDDVALWYDRKKGSKTMVLDQRTPLMVASSYGSINVVKFIALFPKVDVNRSCGNDEITALHCAASSGSTNAIDVVKILLEKGANRNSVDASGQRPFDVILVSPNCLQMNFSLQTLLTTSDSNYSPKSYKLYDSLHDSKNEIYSSDEFRMFYFKIRACSRAYSHDWTECPFLHPGENARRRDPRMYTYDCASCPDFRKGFCRRGDMCAYAHGVFESWLHPNQYRTRICKDGTRCARRVCFFAHKQDELRLLPVSINLAISSPRSRPNLVDFASPIRDSNTNMPHSNAQDFHNHRSCIDPNSSSSLKTLNPSKFDNLFPLESSLSPIYKPISRISDLSYSSSTIWGYNGKSFRAMSTDEFGIFHQFSSFSIGNDREEPDVSWVNSLVKENAHEVNVRSSNEGSGLYPYIDVVDPIKLDTLIEHIHLDNLMAQSEL